MSEFMSVDRINALKSGIESKTGGTYADLTAGVQALMDGYGQSGNTDAEDALVLRNMEDYSNARVTTVGEYAFYTARNLKNLFFPNVTKVSPYAFYGCAGLTEITDANFPNLYEIEDSCFRMCSNLTNVRLSKLATIGSSTFRNCSALITADFPAATTINGSTTFGSDTQFTNLILRADTVVTLTNTNAFPGTPFASGNGKIYVPSSLVNTYKTATNWSALCEAGNTFVSIEGSEFE